MEIRRFKIRIQTPKETLDEFERTWKLISSKKGKARGLDSEDIVLCFSDLSMVSKVLSAERLRLIQAIREKKPVSVNQLAQILGRAQSNVHKDVHFLAELGILKLKKARTTGGKAGSTCPQFNWDGFDIAV